MTALVLSLREGTTLADAGAGQVRIQAEGTGVTLKGLTAGVREALHCLANGGAYEDDLAERVEQRDGTSGLINFYYYLQQLSRRRLLLRSAFSSDRPLATLVPASASFSYPGRSTTPDQSYVLSRFAYLRAEHGEMLLESPLAHAYVRLHDVRVAGLVHALARPGRPSELAEAVPELSSRDAALFLELLLNADLIGEADEAGVCATDRSPALQSWEFHDLLFHARSRVGRHPYPVGGTFRFAGRLVPPPALTAVQGEESLALHRPDLEHLLQHDPPFAHVLESRRSIREYAERPISAQQLGEFLYRVGRVRQRTEMDVPTPHGPVRLELASRPYPAGGALYELELYVAVNACEGLTPGLYQTMYLAATAMGLAPCALGCGNADAFVRAAGTDYCAETSVGEFLLGSLP